MKKADKVLPCGRKIQASVEATTISKRVLSEKLVRLVSEKGLNSSHSRDRILEIVSTLSGHFSASDLIRGVVKKYPGIGPATVYRSLPLFVEAGILRETLTTENGETIFEIEKDHHHDHIVCLDCHSIFEFHNPQIERAQERLSADLNFSPQNHKHVIYARCDLLERTDKVVG